MNEVPEQCKTEEKDSKMDSEGESIHSNWSELIPVEISKHDEALKVTAPQRKRTMRNSLSTIQAKTKRLGELENWTIASPPLDINNQVQGSKQINEEKLSYVPHSPYYEPVHPPYFYEDE